MRKKKAPLQTKAFHQRGLAGRAEEGRCWSVLGTQPGSSATVKRSRRREVATGATPVPRGQCVETGVGALVQLRSGEGHT